MAITKQKKTEIFEKLRSIFKKAESVVFVNFHGVKVSDEAHMRKVLRGSGVGYYVAKKTLLRRALDETAYHGEVPALDGELAVAYGEDLITPAREVYEFEKKFKDSLSILGGVFEGRYLNKAEMTEIASIPPLQTLYGQVVHLINSPIQGFVVALNEIAKKKT